MNLSKEEIDLIKTAHLSLESHLINVVAHAPQTEGGCHGFLFLRGVLPGETNKQAFQRVKPDILQHIAGECGRPCRCNNGEPDIWYTPFGI